MVDPNRTVAWRLAAPSHYPKQCWLIVNNILGNTCQCILIRNYITIMMTSSNGNIFRFAGPLCGEFTGPGEFPAQRPVTRSFDVFFDLRLTKRFSKQPWGWWSETPALSLWRHRNDRSWKCVKLALLKWQSLIPDPNHCTGSPGIQLMASSLFGAKPFITCNAIFRNKFWLNLNENSKLFAHENAFENAICELKCRLFSSDSIYSPKRKRAAVRKHKRSPLEAVFDQRTVAGNRPVLASLWQSHVWKDIMISHALTNSIRCDSTIPG